MGMWRFWECQRARRRACGEIGDGGEGRVEIRAWVVGRERVER